MKKKRMLSLDPLDPDRKGKKKEQKNRKNESSSEWPPAALAQVIRGFGNRGLLGRVPHAASGHGQGEAADPADDDELGKDRGGGGIVVGDCFLFCSSDSAEIQRPDRHDSHGGRGGGRGSPVEGAGAVDAPAGALWR